MLLRLVPEPPLPTILFTLAFGNLPDGMPFPAAWTAQLQHILHDELEMPQCIHALDKAAWAACLLHEVTFNVAARRVSVVFMDGSSADWPLEGEALGSALKVVTDDVNESSVASDMEQRRAKAIQAAAQVQAAQERMPASSSPAPSIKGKHKKSRSLLMSLVASFCPSSHSPALSNLPLAPPPPLSPVELSPPPPEPPQSSRYLRRKARAGLVDVYRRYVLPALANESPFSLRRTGMEGAGGHGYILWNLHSILRRIEVRMHELGMALGSVPSSSSVKSSRSSMSAKKLCASPSVVPEAPIDEEEEVSSATGTVDGSSAESAETEASSTSVHTPRDVLPAYPLMAPAAEEDNARVAKEGGIVTPITPLVSAHQQQPSRTRLRSQRPIKRPSRPSSSQSHHGANDVNPHQQAQQHEFAILHASTIRLRALITRTTSFAQVQADERNVALVQLEKRSRRRAWSCRQLMGGAEVNTGVREGLGQPVRGSGLRLSWTTIEEGDVAGSRLALNTRDGSPLAVPPFVVPSQAGCISFPRVESDEGDDFCSTGPQDTRELFGAGEESENEESDSESLLFGQAHGKENPGNRTPYMRSQSSDDLPSLLSSLSTSPSSSSSVSSSPSTSPPSDSHFDLHVFDDAEIEEMELGRRPLPVPMPVPVPMLMDEYRESDAIQSSNPLYVEEFGVKVKREPIGRGMGLKAHARRRVALVR